MPRGVKASSLSLPIASLLVICGCGDPDVDDPKILLNFCQAEEECGFMDTNGDIVFLPIYEQTRPFSEGLGLFKRDGKWGAINSEGEIAIEPVHRNLFQFSDGLAAIYGSGKTTYIDKAGDVVLIVPSISGGFSKGLAVATNDQKKGVINRSADWVIPPKYAMINPASKQGDRFFALSDAGKTVLVTSEGEERPTSSCGGMFFKEGLAPVTDLKTCHLPFGERKWGYIDPDGNWNIEPAFDFAKYFSEGRGPVKIDDKWGFIDRSGELVIETKYSDAGAFSDGLAPVRIGPIGELPSTPIGEGQSLKDMMEATRDFFRWGYIDRDGNVAIDFTFEKAGIFHQGFAHVERDGKSGFIDRNGKVIVPFIFDDAWWFVDGFASVEFGDKQYYVDRDGRPVGFSFEDVRGSDPLD